jgi:hypothetical protein
MRVLLAVSPVFGFALGFLHFSWVAIVVLGLALAIILVVILQNQGVDFLPGAAGAAGCFAVTLLAYQIGLVARPPDKH